MKILVIGNLGQSLVNFRGHLLGTLARLGHEVVGAAPNCEASLPDNLRDVGVQFRSVSFERVGTNPLKEAAAIANMIRFLRAEKPDAVFLYTIKPVLYGSLAAQLTRVPQIYSMISGLGHTFSNTGESSRMLSGTVRKLYQFILKRNTAVFFQNPDDQALFIEKGYISPSQSVLVNGSGVDLDHYAPAPTDDAAPISFLLVARLLIEKGIRDYVEAARITKRKFPNSEFRILGPFYDHPSGITREEMKAWTEEGVISYLGETKDVRPHLGRSSVFVLPSFYGEGIPRSGLEALAMAKPILTTNHPGCRELVVPGVNGYLVPTRTPTKLAEAMTQCIETPKLLAQYAVASRAIAEERFDVHKVNEVIVRTIEKHSTPSNKAAA